MRASREKGIKALPKLPCIRETEILFGGDSEVGTGLAGVVPHRTRDAQRAGEKPTASHRAIARADPFEHVAKLSRQHC
jgi:hypothetical protein